MLLFETISSPHSSETFTSISYTSLGILFTCSCQHQTEAWKRLVFGKLPATICLQLMRFSSTGKKLQHMVKYDDMMQLCEMQTLEKSQSTEISRVSYKLVAVVVHIDDKLFSGHSYPGLQYTPICESEKEQAELIVTMEHTIPQHSRTRGWEGGDLCRLLPGQEEEGSWLSNFLLNKIFVLI